MQFNVSLKSGDYVCTSGFSSGKAESAQVNLNYKNGSPNSLSSQFFVGINYVESELGDCIQLGGAVEKCSNLFAWPGTWNSNADGAYNANIDISSSLYSFPSGYYQICVGNGDLNDNVNYSEFVGDISLVGLETAPLSTMTISSTNSETLEASYNLTLKSGDYLCAKGFSAGTIQSVTVTVNYENGSPNLLSNQLSAGINFLDSEVGVCIQIGGALEKCNNYFPWPSNFASGADGLYTGTINVASAAYEYPSGEYEICLVNGDQTDDTDYSKFVGTISTPGLTTEPVSTLEIVSGISDTLEAVYNLTLTSGHYICATGYAAGTLETVVINLYYGNGSPDYLSSQLSLGVNYLDSEIGDCIQVGGATERCNNYFSWPTSWNSADDGFYSATVDVSSSSYSFPSGYYQVCLGNSDQLDETDYSTFIGNVTLPALTTEPISTMEVVSTQSEVFETDFDLTIVKGQYVCAYGYAAGTLQYVNISLKFTNGGTSNLADQLALAVNYVGSALGECVQIGGQTEQCNNLYSWPVTWTNTDGFYTTVVDVTDASFVYPSGEYEICLGNADITDSVDFSEFEGKVFLLGLTSEETNTIEITSDIAETIAATYDLTLRSGQYVCVTGFAAGTPTSVILSLTYENGSPNDLSSQLSVGINYLASEVGDCIQIGGAVEKCNNFYNWPASFNNADDGAYTATVDISSAGYTFPSGDYEICFFNGDQADNTDYSGFTGDISVPGLTTEPVSTFDVTSVTGETLEAAFALNIRSGQYVCAYAFSAGTIETFSISLTFQNGGSDFLSQQLSAGVKFLDSSIGDCIQIGSTVEKCNNIFPWPTSWNSANDGAYTATIDVKSANYVFPSGQYEVCLVNGDQSNIVDYSLFTGDLSLPGLSVQPVSTASITSDIGETLAASFDLSLKGGQYFCVQGYSAGDVETVNVTLDFENSIPSFLSDEFAVGINFLDSDIGDCIQIGGGTEKCNNIFSWPNSWNNAASGSYSASIDVSSSDYAFPSGYYEVCFGNGDQTDDTTYSGFTGDISLPGLTTEPVSTFAITSVVGEVIDAAYSLNLRAGQYACVYGVASGTIQSVSISLTYQNGSPDLLSSEIAVGIKYIAAEIGDCIQIGGAVEKCNNLFPWPVSFNSAADGSYSAVIDVSSAAYAFPLGEYEICIGNGDQTGDLTDYSIFIGDISTPGLVLGSTTVGAGDVS